MEKEPLPRKSSSGDDKQEEKTGPLNLAPTHDSDGHPINAHGAGIMLHEGVYYLYGEIKKGPTRLVPGQAWDAYRVEAAGVSCYSSIDLITWKYEGVALAAELSDAGSDLHTSRVMERPKVIYNATTGQFVLWLHVDRADYGYARVGVAVSNRPMGPFRWIGRMRPNGQEARDMTLFADDDGSAYLVYSSENNDTMHICRLSADYLRVTADYKRILIGQRREAPAVFKHGGKYFLLTSSCNGWDPNGADYAVADSLMGDWVAQGNPCVGAGREYTFYSQGSCVLAMECGWWLLLADRWNKRDLERSGYLWLRVQVEDGRVEVRSID